MWVPSHWIAKAEKIEQETRRSEEGKIFVGENDPFPPLTSASPRLLFDFFRFDESLGVRKNSNLRGFLRSRFSLFYPERRRRRWSRGFHSGQIFSDNRSCHNKSVDHRAEDSWMADALTGEE